MEGSDPASACPPDLARDLTNGPVARRTETSWHTIKMCLVRSGAQTVCDSPVWHACRATFRSATSPLGCAPARPVSRALTPALSAVATLCRGHSSTPLSGSDDRPPQSAAAAETVVRAGRAGNTPDDSPRLHRSPTGHSDVMPCSLAHKTVVADASRLPAPTKLRQSQFAGGKNNP